ncbi:cilia- and flagella-associated protein 251-like [Diprion similis]|uniref:cilia- and flagella-associated protein 251-like n=1 Tax=Diprion similis TaxID=362088 RepID=UPI001EF99685|nr:cilia- and flagella-associated protein 251-like [Diprion similis]
MNKREDLSSIFSNSWISSGTPVEDEEYLKSARSPRRSSPSENPKLTPFKLRHSYGINPQVPLVNLTSKDRTLIAYACSHAAALYDYTSRDMHLLQGHQNHVSMISTDTEGKWLLTADSGKDNVVIIWDTETRVPICTLFNPHGMEELLAAKLSPNAKYIVTIGNGIEMRIKFWLWSYGRDESDGHILVWSDIRYREYLSTKRKPSNFKTHVKSLRLQSCEITAITSHENIVVVGNVLGHIKFYDNKLRLMFWCQKFALDRITAISFHLNSRRKAPIQVTSESFVASSTSTLDRTENSEDDVDNEEMNGEASDDQSRGSALEELLLPRKSKHGIEKREKFANLDSNVTISWDLAPPVNPDEDEIVFDNHVMNQKPERIPSDYTLERTPFIIDDFIVFTGTSRIARVETSRLKCHYISHQAVAAVTAIDTHPDRNILATGDMADRIHLYEYNSHHLLVSKQTPPIPSFEDLIANDITGRIRNYVTCLQNHQESLTGVTAYGTQLLILFIIQSPGRELACGMQSGVLWILNPSTLDPEDELPFKHSSKSLLDIIYSEKSDFMAYRDDNMTVGAFHYAASSAEAGADPSVWNFLGKHRSHFLPIREVLFGPPLIGGSVPRLFTLAEDCNFIEYDLENSGPYPEPGLKILKIICIDSSAIPLCMAWYPKFEVERFFVFSNTEHKFKLLNDCTKLIQGTYLGPSSGAPVTRITLKPFFYTIRIQFLPTRNMHNQAYMVFATDTQIGLQLLPFDGNPFTVVGIVGHPQMITHITLSRCGEFLFTLGYRDPCVLMWKINPRAVDIMAKLGGSSLSPFYCLIDGGQDGWLLNEMQDLFYYAQILHQGENTTATRIVSDKVSITQLPNLMRAVGYYPSTYELEELMTEVVSKNYAKTGQLVDEITFEDFVKLYVNHRPVFGTSMQEIKRAFAVFGKPEMEDNPIITREQFIEILTGHGDRMSAEQAYNALSILIPVEDESEKDAGNITFSFLPADISYKDFAVEILGIEPTLEMNIIPSAKDTPH